MIVQRQNNLRIGNRRSADLYAITIALHFFASAAYDQRDWAAKRFIGVPFKLARRYRFALLAGLREEQAGVDRLGRRGMLIGDDHRRAFHGDAKEQFGKFKRQPDAAM